MTEKRITRKLGKVLILGLGTLLVVSGLAVMLVDLVYMEATSSQYGVPFWQETQGFAKGFFFMVVGFGLIIWRMKDGK